MPNMQKLVLACLIVAAIIYSAAGQASKVEKPASAPLVLSVRTDRQTYRMSDKIRMETQLLNAGNEDVYIYEWDLCWNFAQGLSMQWSTPDGKSVHGNFLLDCVPPPPREGNVYAFIRLQPGRFYGLADEMKVSDVVNKPGEYSLSVTYGSSISKDFIHRFLNHDPIFALPVWTMEQPTLNARRLHITIKP
jgi:hypothetical protein